ncbi:MAG: hypothetical protein NTV62_01850 [Candidatus Gribaldobacteria bacterium]|nr:hypothetical protein [Candidatus Gribaldobacteria bacterium]
MKKIIVVGVVVLVLVGVRLVGWKLFGQPEPVACTMEAMLCPDGSSVGRVGPNCEFAECPAINSLLSEAQARLIAEKDCIKGGEALAVGMYNAGTRTWWFDANLNATKEGCNPACVVSEETKTAEINWRCTGVLPLD